MRAQRVLCQGETITTFLSPPGLAAIILDISRVVNDKGRGKDKINKVTPLIVMVFVVGSGQVEKVKYGRAMQGRTQDAARKQLDPDYPDGNEFDICNIWPCCRCCGRGPRCRCCVALVLCRCCNVGAV